MRKRNGKYLLCFRANDKNGNQGFINHVSPSKKESIINLIGKHYKDNSDLSLGLHNIIELSPQSTVKHYNKRKNMHSIRMRDEH